MPRLYELSRPHTVLQLRDSLHNSGVNRGAQELEEFIKSVGERTGALVTRQACNNTTKSRPANKWFDADCKRQKRITNDALKKWKNDYQNKHARSVFFNEKHNFKNITRRKKRKFQNDLNANLEHLGKRNPKEFWKKINKFKGDSNLSVPQSITLKEWQDHFKTLHQSQHSIHNFTPLLPNDIQVSELDVPISLHEVGQVLPKVKNCKSPDIDGVMIEIYKCLPAQIWNQSVGRRSM